MRVILVSAFALSLAAHAAALAAERPAPPQAGAAVAGAEEENTKADGYDPTPAFPGQKKAPAPATPSSFEIQKVAQGLNRPWSIAFLPDGRLLVSEKPTGLRIVERDGALSPPLEGLPPIYYRGPQGMYAVIVSPTFAADRTIYFTYSAMPPGGPPQPGPDGQTPRLAGIETVARARLSADSRRLEDVQVIKTAGVDGRLIMAADGNLFVTSATPAGERIPSEASTAATSKPQRLDSLMGKVLRIRTDGSAPKDNPFAAVPGARPEIYARGFRDAQGVALDPRSGDLWVSENGPKGGDELNHVKAGKNYGWPWISYGHEYSGRPVGDGATTREGTEQPVYFWNPSIAPSGMTFYTGDLFPNWKGNLFIAALAGKQLVRLVMDGDHVVAEEKLLTELDSRIRDVKMAPDGSLYVITDNPAPKGEILRLVPKR